MAREPQIASRSRNLSVQFREQLGKRIRMERTGRGWTLAETAAYSGLSTGELSDLENGRRSNPGIGSLLSLQRAFDLVTIEQLLGSFPSYTAARQAD